MREIKLRAWEKTEERMYAVDGVFQNYVEVNESVNDDGDTELYEDYILMQYTGLKDKSGKEIYEGDIVAIKESQLEPEKETIYIVEWQADQGAFSLVGHPEVFWGMGYINLFDWVKVIGNIYENPELLKEP